MGDYWQPVLVLVSGAPASGKTTLAAELARRLDLVHLNRDQVFNGLRFTVSRGGPREIIQRGVPAHFGAPEHLLAAGVSVVAEGTLYAGEMEQSIRRLGDFAEVVNVHCVADAWRERFFDRQRARSASPEQLDTWSQHFERYGSRIVEPLELACRLIEVRTDEGYEPTMDDLVAELTPPEWEEAASRVAK